MPPFSFIMQDINCSFLTLSEFKLPEVCKISPAWCAEVKCALFRWPALNLHFYRHASIMESK